MKILEAYKLAAQLHAGQVDKAGRPYIDHLVRVMLGVLDAGGDRDQMIAALFHDSIEDGRASTSTLSKAAVPQEAIKLVLALTKPDGMNYMQYISLLSVDRRAALIKRADLADNSDPERLAALAPEIGAKLAGKYRKVIDLLGNGT